MNKKVYIIHGWGGNPNEPMLQWIKNELEKKGFRVVAPAMPNSQNPIIATWVEKIMGLAENPDTNTFFIGHSIGCQTVLRYLEKLDAKTKVGGVVLIAPWMYLDKKTIEEEGDKTKKIAKPWVETPINWKKIKVHTKNFICQFSDNDYYVPVDNKKLFEKNLNAKIIIEHIKGHFSPSDKIIENKTVVDEILKM